MGKRGGLGGDAVPTRTLENKVSLGETHER